MSEVFSNPDVYLYGEVTDLAWLDWKMESLYGVVVKVWKREEIIAESLWPSRVQGFFTVQGFFKVFTGENLELWKNPVQTLNREKNTLFKPWTVKKPCENLKLWKKTC